MSPEKEQTWTDRFQQWLRDPFGIDRAIGRDWSDFAKMTDDELEREFDTLLLNKPRSDRFRRLMHCLALRWLQDRKTTQR